MTYGQLPNRPKSGVSMVCGQGCEGRYSATRGDYFLAPADREITCRECGGAMVLVQRHVTVREIAPAEAEETRGRA